MVVAAVAVGVIISITRCHVMSLACNAIQCNAIQSAERKKSSWRNDEHARRTKAVREWNLQEKLRREEETRAADEERAREVAVAAKALAKGKERCVRSASRA